MIASRGYELRKRHGRLGERDARRALIGARGVHVRKPTIGAALQRRRGIGRKRSDCESALTFERVHRHVAADVDQRRRPRCRWLAIAGGDDWQEPQATGHGQHEGRLSRLAGRFTLQARPVARSAARKEEQTAK